MFRNQTDEQALDISELWSLTFKKRYQFKHPISST
jgi:hypothetical protein